jgi:uncharacterized protein
MWLDMADSGRPTLHPSSVGQFFRLQSCPQYLQWEYDEEGRATLARREWEPKAMSPVLSSEGDTFEQSQLTALDDGTRDFYGIDGDTGIAFTGTWPNENEIGRRQLRDRAAAVAAAEPGTEESVVFQPHFRGTIGAYELAGKGDLLVLESVANGVRPTLLEVKSSSEQKVHHRYQATIYAVLLGDFLDEHDIPYEPDDGTPRTCIVTPSNPIESGPSDPESFAIHPYHAKLELKLQAGGSFDRTILDTPFEETTNRIARRCSGCEYEPLCLTRGVEQQGLELLGLQAGTQETLHRLGIHDVEDFAMLFEHPEWGRVHWNYEALEPRNEELVRRVRQEADIASLQKRAQIAYRFLVELDDAHGRDGPDWYPNPLRGTGNALPEDRHGEYEVDWTEFHGPDYPSESLVRVYWYVQQDHAQNRVTLLAATVECSLTDQRRSVCELPEAIPTADSAKQAEEDRLFTAFFESLAEAVTAVAPDWSERPELAELDLTADQGFLHVFLYSDTQRQALMDAVRRHPEGRWRRALRTLLGLRSGLDQQMVSVLQEDFRNRWALRFPGLGIIQSVAQFQWGDEWFDWRRTRADGTEASIDELFAMGMFDATVRYQKYDGALSIDHTSPEPAWTPEDRQFKRWIYPVQNRDTEQLPVEYIWGLFDRLDPDATDDPAAVEQYRYRDGTNGERIDREDIRLGAESLTLATRHIERTIEDTDMYAKDRFVDKEPVDLADVRTLSFDPRTLDEVCVEYQQLEYETNRETTEAYYCQPLSERLDSGGSLRFECTAVDTDEDRVRGRLLLSDGRKFDPVVHDGLVSGSISVSDDDFMVITRLDFDGDRPEAFRGNSPESIRNSTTVVVSDIDQSTGEITVTTPWTDGWPNRDRYSVNHRGWDTTPDAKGEDWTTYLDSGEEYVLDPMFDNVVQNYAHEALEHAVDAPVRRWIRQVYTGRRERIPLDRWNSDHIEAYVDTMEANDYGRPNEQQQSLVTDIDHGIVVLQGPPGTGKTSFSVAPTILSRAHSSMQMGEEFVGAISAVSHSAVDEALKSVLKLLEACPPGPEAEELELVRVCSSSGQEFDDDRVTSVQYSEAKTETLQRLYESYLSPDGDNDGSAIFFGPPASLRSCLNKILRTVSKAPSDSITVAMSDGTTELFDTVVIDEASMMDLPLCFLVASFVDENGQFVLVGDHRQMEPIQKHEWDEEDREPIERHNPFLSALDFLRYLRGEDVDLEHIEREPPELSDPDETFPVHRLEETHRLPPESASLHTDLFYEQDGIKLESVGQSLHIPEVEGSVGEILDSQDARVTLLLHDEAQSQKSNPVEQALVTELLQSVSDSRESNFDTTESDLSCGVVVPFRAQRRNLGHLAATVDTVERFQGGERDLMVLSMTASERGYISQLSEFLLDPRRFNVGASRMKRKLVVIASVGLFEESSDDVDTFEQQESWVSFLQGMGGIDGEDQQIRLSQLVSPGVADQLSVDIDDIGNPTVRIYSGYESP